MLHVGWPSEHMHGARPALTHAGGVGRRNGGWLEYLLRDEYLHPSLRRRGLSCSNPYRLKTRNEGYEDEGMRGGEEEGKPPHRLENSASAARHGCQSQRPRSIARNKYSGLGYRAWMCWNHSFLVLLGNTYYYPV